LFDEILLLARGGRVAYNGPSNAMIAYFEANGYHPPKFCNPADFILDITSIDSRSPEAEIRTTENVEKLIEVWGANIPENDTEDTQILGNVNLREVLSFSRALPVLLHRSIINSKRRFHVVLARIFQVVSLGIIQSLYFARLQDNQVSVLNRLGILVIGP
jgi:hypothetical protein